MGNRSIRVIAMTILIRTIVGASALALIGSAHAVQLVYQAALSGPNEAPPNASAGTGNATITIDTVLPTLRVQATFSGLTGTTTASHTHCCTVAARASTAGVATLLPTFTGFPLSVTSGTYDQTYAMTLDIDNRFSVTHYHALTDGLLATRYMQ